MKKNYQHLKLPPDKYPYVKKFPKPIEVFCPSKYKDYYVRGQILDFPYEVTCSSQKSSTFYYQLYLLVLVNPLFDNMDVAVLPEYYRFGKILGKTKKDFKSIDSSLIRRVYGEGNKIIKQEKLPSSRTVKLKDFGIVENDYLKECLSKNQDIILVSLGISSAVEVDPKTGRVSEARHACIYPFMASYFGFGHYLEDDVRAWFSQFYDILCFEFDYKGISKNDLPPKKWTQRRVGFSMISAQNREVSNGGREWKKEAV